MRGKMPANFRRRDNGLRYPGIRKGFSLVEILIVILIMGVLVGVVGSLMSGYVNFYEMTDNQSIAARRAQDVFNALEFPIQNAGVGIPAKHMDSYFTVNSGRAPVAPWGTPLSVLSNDAGSGYGNALRIVYSIPAGAKNGPLSNLEFSGSAGDWAPADTKDYESRLDLANPVSFNISEVGGILRSRRDPSAVIDTRSFITFPGAHMHPVMVLDSSTERSLDIRGKRPFEVEASSDVLARNVIRAFHDVYAVRAAVAYVDRDSVFHLLDVGTEDSSSGSGRFPVVAPGNAAWSGFRVEGIKAVRFEQGPERRFIRVHILAEGDVSEYTSDTSASVPSQLRYRWPDVAFDDHVHYEDFSMTWRTRNLQEN